jgi:pimeloyl-ACP methyl ester carboxylesterase
MGAAVVSVAAGARPDLVGHLTLLAGVLPVEGKPLSYQLTAASIGGSSEAACENEATTERTKKFTEDGASFYWDRDGAFQCFFHDCNPELVDWAAERLVPQPLAPVLEPISIPKLWQSDLSRSYIICSQDRSLPSRIARLQARRLGVRPLEIDSSHSPFFSRPAQLAELLVHAAGTTPIGPLVPGEEVP